MSRSTSPLPSGAATGAGRTKAQLVAEFTAAGATWYQVSFGANTSRGDVLSAIRRGPPGRS